MVFSTRHLMAFAFALVLAGFQVSRHWSTIMDQGSLKREEFAAAQAVLARVLDRRTHRVSLVSPSFGTDPTGILVTSTTGSSSPGDNQHTTATAVVAELVLTAKLKNPLARRDGKTAPRRRGSTAAGGRKPTKGQTKWDKRQAAAGAADGGRGRARRSSAALAQKKRKKQLRDVAAMKFFFHLTVYDPELGTLLHEALDAENLLPFARAAGRRPRGPNDVGGAAGDGGADTLFASMPPRESFSERRRRLAEEEEARGAQPGAPSREAGTLSSGSSARGKATGGGVEQGGKSGGETGGARGESQEEEGARGSAATAVAAATEEDDALAARLAEDAARKAHREDVQAHADAITAAATVAAGTAAAAPDRTEL